MEDHVRARRGWDNVGGKCAWRATSGILTSCVTSPVADVWSRTTAQPHITASNHNKHPLSTT